MRKHIRIEHQLKLHIESVEDRVEELERDLAKAENAGASIVDKTTKNQLEELRSRYDQ